MDLPTHVCVSDQCYLDEVYMPSIVTWRCSCGRRYRAQFDKAENVSRSVFRCPYCKHEENGPFNGARVEVQDELGTWVGVSSGTETEPRQIPGTN